MRVDVRLPNPDYGMSRGRSRARSRNGGGTGRVLRARITPSRADTGCTLAEPRPMLQAPRLACGRKQQAPHVVAHVMDGGPELEGAFPAAFTSALEQPEDLDG